MIWLCKDAIRVMAALQSEMICELLMVLDRLTVMIKSQASFKTYSSPW